MKNKFFLSLLIIAFPVISLAAEHDEVQKWLKKMHWAAHTLNYEGTFVYGQKDQLSSMRIIHKATSKQEQERLVSMDGSGREVIRNGDTVKCIMPDTKRVVVEKSRPKSQFPPMFPKGIDRLKDNYNFSINASGKVAGRNTQMISITPKDKLRYGHHLWVDKETGLLLKTHLLNENGKKLEQFMFTQINYVKDVPDEWLKPEISGENFEWFEAKNDSSVDVTKSKQPGKWKVTSLPDGYMPDMTRYSTMPVNGMPVEHMMFSDGLASISVFIEKSTDKKDNLVGSSHMGAVHAHGHKKGGFQITVVGEAPLAAIKMISQSVKQVSK